MTILLIWLFFLCLYGKLSHTSGLQRLPFIYLKSDEIRGINFPQNGQFLYNATGNFSYQFEIKITALHDLRQQRVSALFDLRLNPVTKAKEVCSAFDQRLVPRKELDARCMIPLIHSIRWRLVEALGRLAFHYQNYPHDGELYGLAYAYEESESFPSLIEEAAPTKRVCILGEPHATSLFPALASLIISEVIIIRDPTFGENTDHYHPNHYTWSDDFYVIAAMLGKTLRVYESLRSFKDKCHIIQIEPQITLSPLDLYFTINRLIDQSFTGFKASATTSVSANGVSLPMDTSSPVINAFARIIWNSYYHYRGTNGDKNHLQVEKHQRYDHLFTWQLSSTWCLYAQFQLMIDSNGFTQKAYAFVDGVNDHLVTTRIALYSPQLQRRQQQVNPKSSSPDLQPSPSTTITQSKLIKMLEIQRQYIQNRLDYILLITTVNRVLIENALGLLPAIRSLGYSNVQMIYDLTVAAYESLYIAKDYTDDKIVQLYLGPSDISLFARQFIAFNTEQQWQNLVFGQTYYRFYQVLSQATTIWCFYDPLTKALAETFGANRTHTITLYTHQRSSAVMAQVAPTIANILGVMNAREVLYFGSPSERRMKILEYLMTQFQPFLPSSTAAASSNPRFLPFSFRIITGSWDQLSFDYEREIFVTHASIVININNHKDSALETHRLNYLLSMEKCIISERGSDPQLTKLYEDAVIFIENQAEMAQKVIEYMQSIEKRELCKLRAKRYFQGINQNYQTLEPVLNQIFYQLSNGTSSIPSISA